MAILPFRAAKTDATAPRPGTILHGYSIKVITQTTAKIRGSGRERAGVYCRPPIGITSAARTKALTEKATDQGGVA
jgi:hypothetical protein